MRIAKVSESWKREFFGGVLAVFFLVALKLPAQEQASAPTFKERDFWQFKSIEKEFIGDTSDPLDGVYELVHSQGQIKIFKLT